RPCLAPFSGDRAGRKALPALAAFRAARRLSGHEPDQRSGTSVTARPDEQFGPNKPIFSALALYMLMRSRIDAWGASKFVPRLVARGFFTAFRWQSTDVGHDLSRPPPPA